MNNLSQAKLRWRCPVTGNGRFALIHVGENGVTERVELYDSADDRDAVSYCFKYCRRVDLEQTVPEIPDDYEDREWERKQNKRAEEFPTL